MLYPEGEKSYYSNLGYVCRWNFYDGLGRA